MPLNPTIADVTRRIIERSRPGREQYLARIDAARDAGPHRRRLSCGNLALGFAACGPHDKAALRGVKTPNLGIVTAYNDMLSAHQPYERFPELIRNPPFPPVGRVEHPAELSAEVNSIFVSFFESERQRLATEPRELSQVR